MKKLIALLMVMTMIVGLVGCSNAEDPDSTYDTTPITVPQEVLDTAVRSNADFYPLTTNTTLRVLFNEEQGETDASKLWEEVTGVDLDVLQWDRAALTANLAAGEIPDAIILPWDLDKATVYEYGSAGKFLNFKEHLSKMPNLCALIREYPEILQVCAYPDGAMYSLPKVAWSNTSQGNLLYIRTDLMEQLGYTEPPTNTDAFLEFIQKAQAQFGSNPQFKAFMPANKTFMEWSSQNSVAGTFFPSFGPLVETGLTVDKSGEVVLGASTEQYRLYLEFMNKVWASGAFETEIYTLDNATGRAAIQNGHCIVSIGTHASDTAFSDGVAKVEIMKPLTSKYQGTPQWRRSPTINYVGCVANANCADLDTLLAFLDSFYATEENPLNKEGTIWGYSITKGVLGVHWTKDDANKTWTDTGKEFVSYASTLYSGEFTYKPLGDLKIKGEGTTNNLMPYSVPISPLSTISLSPNDQLDYNDLWMGLDRYISQMHAKFITGEEDLETGWDNYLNELNKRGLEEVLEIYERAYAAYLATDK